MLPQFSYVDIVILNKILNMYLDIIGFFVAHAGVNVVILHYKFIYVNMTQCIRGTESLPTKHGHLVPFYLLYYNKCSQFKTLVFKITVFVPMTHFK